MELVLLAIGVGLGVGIVVGALGAGGGILAVPVLVFLLGMPPHAATASSLVIVLITALASLPHHARQRNVEWRAGLVFAGVSVVGAVLGSRLSALVPPDVLLTLFGVMLAVVAAAMLRRGRRTRRTEDAEAAALGTAPLADGDAPIASHDDPVLDQPGPDTVETADGLHHHHGEPDLPFAPAASPSPRLRYVIAAASLTGFLTGFFGVGGGFIVVPMLVIALGLAMRRASGTSLLVMIIATATSLLARLGTDVQVDWATTLVFAAGSAVGGVLGGPLSAKARPSTLTLLFAALLAGVAAVTLVETLLL
ncbi:sulfite exporter TauE/SafE family protein [Brachybacterium paraconglomeratum]|uniref:sulfite exporter TauE/SafE family protein n=1 Tax=Brachybacterium paraconglomeratum TaxID=173362 RepID=UPI00223B44FC|nr:sulfite exporter TauE/SafE family protein [Brachybacterium paraconglomeratum]MCT1437754.1 sulfite exporter TauE/SafE family protein [Brachybacterium paraconglomeratum]